MKKLFIILSFVFFASFLSGCDTTTSYKYADSEKYLVGDSTFNSVDVIDISWISGTVHIDVTDDEKGNFYEKYKLSLEDKRRLHYYNVDKTLYIKYAASGIHSWKPMAKDLFLNVSKSDLVSKKYIINTVSANVYIDNQNISTLSANSVSGDIALSTSTVNDYVEIETVSGAIVINNQSIGDYAKMNTVSGNIVVNSNVAINKLEAATTSGKIALHTTLIKNLNIESISGDIIYTCDNFETESKALINSVSGNINLFFRGNISLKIDFDTTSGDFNSFFAYKNESNYYIYGNGKSNFSIETVSGDVNIKELVVS